MSEVRPRGGTPPAISGLHHVTVPTADPVGASHRYVQVFGFERLLIEEQESEVVATLLEHRTGYRPFPFAEVEGGLDAETALFEARRCLPCGTCFECDNCYGLRPDNAITKLGPDLRFAIDYEYCKGCGICVEECPAGAITLEPEES